MSNDTADMVSLALRRAWQLGQTFWRQADHEFTSYHKKAEITEQKFNQLVEDTRAELAALQQEPVATLLCGEVEFTSGHAEQNDDDIEWHLATVQKISAANPGARIDLYAALQPLAAPVLSDHDAFQIAVAIRELEWADVPYPTLVTKIRALLAKGTKP